MRPDVDGRFLFRQVPSGNYLVAAASAEQGQWQDPSFLETLLPRATPIVVKENGVTTPASIVLRSSK